MERSLRLNPPTYIIGFTASVLNGARRCLDIGMQDFLAKPVTLDALKDVIARAAVSLRPPVAEETS